MSGTSAFYKDHCYPHVLVLSALRKNFSDPKGRDREAAFENVVQTVIREMAVYRKATSPGGLAPLFINAGFR